ncbi:Zinc finger, GATA-type [Dillenia turbinata]|uniref:Zinc finger, GATA-type n=1 Tax=Dillenia turbinata TaxID=194707 RepID=A0AAN8WAP5_9MAGN
MTHLHLNSQTSPFPVDLNEDQTRQILSPKYQTSSSSSSSPTLRSPIFCNTIHDHGGCSYGELQHPQDQQMVEKVSTYGESHTNSTYETSSNTKRLLIWKKQEKHEDQGENNNNSMKWMSSKMRLIRKMMNSNQPEAEKPPLITTKFEDHHHQSLNGIDTNSSANNSNMVIRVCADCKTTKTPLWRSGPTTKFEDHHHQSLNGIDTNSSANNSNMVIRVCADCNTTKTPLWRSGPRGPKSLCNACGIRQRKARRAMAATAAAANGTIVTAENKPSLKIKVKHKDKNSNNNVDTSQFKKKCKIASPQSNGKKKLCFEDFAISLTNKLPFHQVFPQDEKEAAILLMALSYGLVHG